MAGFKSQDFSAKIDDQVTNGLLGTKNSAAYRIHEIEKHFHNNEDWCGLNAGQPGDNWAERSGLTPFQAISGNGDFGSDPGDEAQVLGLDDTPARADMVEYDLHRILIVDASSTTQYVLRVVYGTGTLSEAIAAEQYSTVMVKEDPALFGGSGQPVDIMLPRKECGVEKVWIQVKNASNNATLDFFVGIHEYVG